MVKRIWKYPLVIDTTTGKCNIEMPSGAEILCAQSQGNQPCIWAMVDDQNKTETRKFIVYGTGHKMLPQKHKYIGTFQIMQGVLIFHVFEI